MEIKIKYQPYGNKAILLEWVGGTPQKRLHLIRDFSEKLNELKLKEIVECNFVYNTMLVTYNYRAISYNELLLILKEINSKQDKLSNIQLNHFKIPVCYDESIGEDLEVVAIQNNLTIADVIKIHSKTKYTIYGIGFLPGFLYLGGLSEKIFCNRRPTPRLKVPKGAVAIGGNQTGIYPQESPGGWQIIGKTPISLFDITDNPPSKFKPGDTIEFQPISLKEFEVLEIKINHKLD